DESRRRDRTGRRRRQRIPRLPAGRERSRGAVRGARALRLGTHGGVMNGATVIRNARHWRTGERLDLAFDRGVILASGLKAAARVIDPPGRVLAPGLVALHVPLREPGQSAKETIERGPRAAAAGGFTAVACMPNTEPVLDCPAWIEW